MLSALVVAGIIKPRAVLAGNLGIVFLDPPAHFLDERGAQLGERCEHGPRIAVLGLDQGPNIAGQGGGGAQNLLPVRGLQPRIIVAQRNPMQGRFRAALCDSWRWGGAGSGPFKLAHPYSSVRAPRRPPHRSGKARGLWRCVIRARPHLSTIFSFSAIKCMHCYLRKPSVAPKRVRSS